MHGFGEGETVADVEEGEDLVGGDGTVELDGEPVSFIHMVTFKKVFVVNKIGDHVGRELEISDVDEIVGVETELAGGEGENNTVPFMILGVAPDGGIGRVGPEKL